MIQSVVMRENRSIKKRKRKRNARKDRLESYAEHNFRSSGSHKKEALFLLAPAFEKGRLENTNKKATERPTRPPQVWWRVEAMLSIHIKGE